MTVYNHGGGLGTDVIYLPGLNASISIAAVDADKRPVAVEISHLLALKLQSLKYSE
ncbi:hypothetical protein [Chryseobacterium gossypii]|uniref:hypothetical protein n=1 Tax=Chryseobacterium gossypii TaxID=3231602 RepID=UPI0035249633